MLLEVRRCMFLLVDVEIDEGLLFGYKFFVMDLPLVDGVMLFNIFWCEVVY